MVSHSVIVDVINYWHERIMKEKVIERDLYKGLVNSLTYEEVTVLTGIRRSGKTYLLFDLLKKHGGIYVNFEDDRLKGFQIEDFDKLFDIVIQRGERILYLDEVQEAPGWEKFAHRAHHDIKMFVTGSNSCLLSSDLSSALVGRTMTFVCKPLNYNEFLRFRDENPSKVSLLEYMRLGGFPRIVLKNNTGLAREYLDRIIYYDVFRSSSVRNSKALMDLALYLLSNIGKEFSYRSLRDVSGLKNDETVKQYLDLLEKVFLFTTIKRYSGSLRKQHTYPKKVYAVDSALIGLGKRLDDDRGLVLENIIFNHLAGSWDIYYCKNGADVDFLLCQGTRPKEVVNVTFEVTDKKGLERETCSLLKATKEYDVKPRLVSVYSVKDLPNSIEGDLAHQFLSRLEQEPKYHANKSRK